jgi:hypothetical protein
MVFNSDYKFVERSARRQRRGAQQFRPGQPSGGGPGSQATNLLLRQHGDDSNVGLFME